MEDCASNCLINRNCFARVKDKHRHIVAKLSEGKVHVYKGSVKMMVLKFPTKVTCLELQQCETGRFHLWIACHQTLYKKSLHLSDTASCSASNEDMDVDNRQPEHDDVVTDHQTIFPHLKYTGNHSTHKLVCQLSVEEKAISCPTDIVGLCCSEKFLAVGCIKNRMYEITIHPIVLATGELSVNTKCLCLPLLQLHTGRSQAMDKSDLPVLYTIARSGDPHTASSTLQVSNDLFSLFFGWQSCLSDTSVVLCCLPSGTILYYVVAMWLTSNSHKGWQVLCSVDSPVIAIEMATFTRKLSEDESTVECLQNSMGIASVKKCSSFVGILVVGNSGNSCLLSAAPIFGMENSSVKVISVFSFPNFVYNLCCDDNAVFVCTKNHLLSCSLTLVTEKKDDVQCFKVMVDFDTLYNMAISSLWLSDSKKCIICESCEGNLLEVHKSPTGSGCYGSTCCRDTSIANLLVGVETKQSRLEKIQAQHEHVNTMLRQVSAAAHSLMFLPQTQSSPFYCNVSVHHNEFGHTSHYCVSVSVSSNNISVSNHWTLLVACQSVDTSRFSGFGHGNGRDDFPVSHAFPLSNGLKAGQSMNFTIPLPYSEGCLAHKVIVYLILHADSLMPNEDLLTDSFTNRCLAVRLLEKDVDILSFLHKEHQKSGSLVLPNLRYDMALLNGHRWQDGRMPDKLQDPPTHIYAIKKYFRSEVPTDSKNTRVIPACKEENDPISLLHHLLLESQVDCSQLNEHGCCLVTPDDKQLSITIKWQPSDNDATDEKTATTLKGYFWVTITSSYLSLLAGLHHSLCNNFLNTPQLQLTFVWNVQTVGRQQRYVTLQHFQNVITKTEVLQCRLDRVRVQYDGERKSYKPNVLPELCSLYEELRNDCL